MKIIKYSLRLRLNKASSWWSSESLGWASTMISVHRLKKLFLQLYEDMSFITHHCCSNWYSPLENYASLCCHGCTNFPIEFLQILVEPQLQQSFKVHGCTCMCCYYCAAYMYIIDSMFWKLIQQRLATPRDLSSLLQDLYDGSEYRRHRVSILHKQHFIHAKYRWNSTFQFIYHFSMAYLPCDQWASSKSKVQQEECAFGWNLVFTR